MIIKNEPGNYQFNKFYGTDYELTNDSLYFKADTGQEFYLGLNDVESLWFHDGSKAAPGMLIGLGAGYLYGIYSISQQTDRSQGVLILGFYGSVGFGSGLLIGWMIPDYNKMPLTRHTRYNLSYSLIPSYDPLNKSFCLNFSIRF